MYAGFAGLVILLVAVLADWALLPGRRGLLIEREVAGSVGIGDKVEGTMRVSTGTANVLREATFSLATK